MTRAKDGGEDLPPAVREAFAQFSNRTARLRLIKTENGIEVRGLASEDVKEQLTNLANQMGVKVSVKFRTRMLPLQVEFSQGEELRLRRAAALLGISVGAYLRLCERECAGRILDVWQTVLDHRARAFVETSLGINTPPAQAPSQEGIDRLKKRLGHLAATVGDADSALHPTKELRPNWAPPTFKGDFHEQELARALLSEDENQRRLATEEIGVKLAHDFFASVETYKKEWIQLIDFQATLTERFVGRNQVSLETIKREITFINRALTDLNAGSPLGYRRGRMLGSALPSARHPSGRGYGRWRTNLFTIEGGLTLYDAIIQIKELDRKKRTTRRRALLLAGLKKWLAQKREDLVLAKRKSKVDQDKLTVLAENPQLWHNLDRLRELVGA